MIDVLVVFGSDSDSAVYTPIMAGLKDRGIKADLRICSAHRTAEKLQSILKQTNAHIVIAGAGLSAALPGVIASHSIKPVVGIPVDGNYSGLDALLSVHQMPGGMPVLGVGVNNVEEACNAVALALRGHKSIRVLNKLGENEDASKRLYKGVSVLEELGAEFEIVEDLGLDYIGEKEIVINLHEFGKEVPERKEGLIINVPMKKGSEAKDAIALLGETKKGLWVGLNRVENACIAAVQLLNIGNSSFSAKINSFREKQKQKVLEADERERKK